MFADEPTAAEINKAVEQLGAADFKTRDAATDTLLKAGKEAVPALRKAKQDADPEVRERARTILEKLTGERSAGASRKPEGNQAEQRFGPGRVIVNGRVINVQGGGQLILRGDAAVNVIPWNPPEKMADKPPATPPPDKQPAEQQKTIENLIRDFGDASFQKREQAQADLIRIGKPALPLLRSAVDGKDPEVAERARRAITEIERPAPSVPK